VFFLRVFGDIVEFEFALPIPDELVVADADGRVRGEWLAVVGVLDADVEWVVPDQRARGAG
jgi:hypothetical protein